MMNIIAVNIESDIIISVCNHFIVDSMESVIVMQGVRGFFYC